MPHVPAKVDVLILTSTEGFLLLVSAIVNENLGDSPVASGVRVALR